MSLLGQLMWWVLTYQPGLTIQQVGVDSFLGQKALVRCIPLPSPVAHSLVRGPCVDQ